LRNTNLPSEKQYVITKNVPCPRRVKELHTQFKTNEKEVEEGWIDPYVEFNLPIENQANSIKDVDEMLVDNRDINDIPECLENSESKSNGINHCKGDIKDFPVVEEIKDISSLEGNNLENFIDENIEEPKVMNNTFQTRTYDISITYDFYYQTTRFWLFGYKEDGQPLSSNEIFEDIMSDYAEKTVTIENHPHDEIKCASIHPCKHSVVMKRIIDSINSNGGQIDVRMAMFVFLKFIGSIVPTIEYDFTMDVQII